MSKTKTMIFESEEEVYDLYKNEGKKVVLYQGVVYEVGEYMVTHPGGQEFIENELGTNIDVKFEEAEHTKAAKNIFKDLEVVGKLKNSDETSTTSSDERRDSSTGNVKKSNVTSNGASHLDGDKLQSTRDFNYNKGLWI